jgi:hypothetical protein
MNPPTNDLNVVTSAENLLQRKFQAEGSLNHDAAALQTWALAQNWKVFMSLLLSCKAHEEQGWWENHIAWRTRFTNTYANPEMTSVVEWPGYARKQKMHDISAAGSRWTLCWNLWATRFEIKQFGNRAPFPKVLSWIVEFLMLADKMSSWLCFCWLFRKYNLISCSVNHVTDHIYTPEEIVIITKSCFLNATTCDVFCITYSRVLYPSLIVWCSWDPGEPNLTRHLRLRPR